MGRLLFMTGRSDGSDDDVRGGGGARAAGPPVPALGRRAPHWAYPAPAPSPPQPLQTTRAPDPDERLWTSA